MRTKTLLIGAVALAAGLLSSQAQSSNVYSANVVGYVNTVIEGAGAYNFICNPLSNTVANDNATLFAVNQQDGATILRWDPDTYNFNGEIATYFTEFSVWDTTVALPVGKGFFYVNPGEKFTNTFVGEVVQGAFNNPVSGVGAYNAIGSSAPVGGVFTNAIDGLVPTDGDTILTWDTLNYNFKGTILTYFSEFGVWDNDSHEINVGEGFYYIRQGDPYTWVRNFTVK